MEWSRVGRYHFHSKASYSIPKRARPNELPFRKGPGNFVMETVALPTIFEPLDQHYEFEESGGLYLRISAS